MCPLGNASFLDQIKTPAFSREKIAVNKKEKTPKDIPSPGVPIVWPSEMEVIRMIKKTTIKKLILGGTTPLNVGATVCRLMTEK